MVSGWKTISFLYLAQALGTGTGWLKQINLLCESQGEFLNQKLSPKEIFHKFSDNKKFKVTFEYNIYPQSLIS